MIARRLRCVPAVCVVLAAACDGDETDTSESATPSASATVTAVVETERDSAAGSTSGTDAEVPVSGIAVELPDTLAGQQLRWVLQDALDAADMSYPEHFSAEFLAQIPVAELRTTISDVGVSEVLEIVDSSPTQLVVIAASPSGTLALSITVAADQPHLILGLQARPTALPDPPASWEGIDTAIADAAPRAAYFAAEVDDLVALTTIRAAGSSEPVALGSAFKLYVLGALVQAVESGEIGWDDELTITDALKSVTPGASGELRERPAGDTVTVREAAEKMIQISDNTATDLLIDRLGRDAVEAMLTPIGMSTESQQLTLPFLTTRELFILKWGIDRSELDAYIAANVAGRREILAGLGDQLPTLADFDADVPVAIDDVEWFATAPEIAAAHLWLDAYRDRPGFEPLAAILGTNPGRRLDPRVWSQASFKGGSEPGVVFLGWLLHRHDGRQFIVVVAASNPDATVDELQIASIAQGIIEQVATQT